MPDEIAAASDSARVQRFDSQEEYEAYAARNLPAPEPSGDPDFPSDVVIELAAAD